MFEAGYQPEAITVKRSVGPGGWGVLTHGKYVAGVTVCFDLLKMSRSFIQNCCITASFTASRMNSWTLSLHWSCLCWRVTMLPYLINFKETVSSNQCLCCSTGLKVIMTQDKTPKRECKWLVVDNPQRSRLTRCPSHDWSSTARVAHQGRRSWWGEALTPWEYVGRVRVCSDPLKCQSFIQSCCFKVSQHQGWTVVHYHFSDPACLYWRRNDPYVWSAPSRQCRPINAFVAIMGLKVIVAQDKTPKRGYRWPADDNPHRWCNRWRSRGVHLPWQYKGVLMATADRMFYAGLDVDPLDRRHKYTGGFRHELSATDT